MVDDDTAYYRQRARRERQMATLAGRERVAATQEMLARHYQALAEQCARRPRPSPDPLDTSYITG